MHQTFHFGCAFERSVSMENKMTKWLPRILRNAALVLMGGGLAGAQLSGQEQKAAAPKSSSAAAKSAATSKAAATNAQVSATVHGQELTAVDLSAFLDGL